MDCQWIMWRVNYVEVKNKVPESYLFNLYLNADIHFPCLKKRACFSTYPYRTQSLNKLSFIITALTLRPASMI